MVINVKKLMNSSDNFVDESLDGIVSAYSDSLKKGTVDKRTVLRKSKSEKVAIVTGGGYGHMPTFMGYVGPGFCDACAIGNIFTSPSAESIYNAAKEAESGKGILLLFANYVGDCLNFDAAKDMLEMDDFEVNYVNIADDVASGEKAGKSGRRGIAGIYFAYKIAGACAEDGKTLEEVTNIAKVVNKNVSSMGFAFSPCVLPGNSEPLFTLNDDEMELGMGIHGEPGIERSQAKSADEIAEIIVNKLCKDQSLTKNDEIAILVNSLGGTSIEELGVFYNNVKKYFTQKNINIYKCKLGSYATSIDMQGASVSICKLNSELKKWLDAPGETPFIK